MDKKASPCARCRAMKIRCDGKEPCGPCSRARTEVICDYTNIPTIISGSELRRRGEACSACRRKKKKCSGNWPCLTCVAARKEDDCTFDDNSQLSSTRALIERTHELEKLLHQAKQMNPDSLDYQLDPGIVNELDQLGFTYDSPLPLTIPSREDAEAVAGSNEAGPSEPTFLESVSFDLLPVTLVHDTAGNPNRSDSLDVVPNLCARTESEEEKLFRLRNLFLQMAPSYGFSLSQKKLDAIAQGDMTGLVVHPVLVHVCYLWGYLLDFLKQTGTSVHFGAEEESTHMRLIQGSLDGMFGPTPNPVTSILTYTTVALYFLKKVQLDRGQEFLAAASKAAFGHDIDLACLGNVHSDEINHGFSAFPGNDADEMRAVFSHLIYVATVVHLVVKKPLVVDARLVDKFRLLMSTQVATHVDMNFMRAKSVRLFAETRQLTSTWNGSALGSSPPTLWFERYWNLIEQIHSHIGLLQPASLKVSFIPDYHTIGLALKLSMILALAALADLYATFAPSHPGSSRRYRDAITEIVSISSTFAADDFQYLSTILSLCWMVATQGILENRIVYENQQSIITTIRQCNENLKQAFPDHNAFIKSERGLCDHQAVFVGAEFLISHNVHWKHLSSLLRHLQFAQKPIARREEDKYDDNTRAPDALALLMFSKDGEKDR
ncbi:hypothetical protein C8J57DRAFT_1467309 [Mycena rebaudengoi]|nr:hypothetical protein C8J57DRAFT_1467309 [Mycena rebaudengoi]